MTGAAPDIMRFFLIPLAAFLIFFAAPIGLKAALTWSDLDPNWRSADRTSAGLLDPAVSGPAAVRIYSARTVRWRGIFAVHSWIVLKEAGKPYERYDLTAWGSPIRVNGFVPDGRWFGQVPEVAFAADGPEAAAIIGRMKAAIAAYPYAGDGDYAAWPGPNSNTFVAAVMAAVPEIGASLPPTAIGKDFPHDGRWIGLTPSRTGMFATLGGYAGVTLGWVEGLEINLFGAVAGLDVRRPAIKLPAFGRIGMSGYAG